MRLRAAVLALALTAPAACAPYPISPAEPPPSATPPPVAVTPAPAPPRPVPRPDVSVRDQCGAAELQRLVGHPRTEIPIPTNPNRQRVACTTCPITQDYDPGRLNFFFDAQTGLIREVRCG